MKVEEIKRLEEKINNKKENRHFEKVEDKNMENIDKIHIIEEIQRNYRLINNTTRRIEKQNQYIEEKLDKLLAIIDTDIDLAELQEIQRQKEIAELENRLKELKGGE